MSLNYGEIFEQSFKLVWKYKILWLFGFIMMLCGQGAFRGNVNFQQTTSFEPNPNMSPEEQLEQFEQQFETIQTILFNFLENPWPYLIGLFALSAVWWVVSNIVGWLAHGAIIGLVDKADEVEAVSVGQGFKLGSERVRPLFVIALLLALPLLILYLPVWIWAANLLAQISEFISIGEPLTDPEQLFEAFIGPQFAILFGCLVPLICLGTPVGIVLWLLNQMAARSCVIENLGAIDSIKRGWQLGIRNVGYVLLTWVIFALVGFIVSIAIAIPALIMTIPLGDAVLFGEWDAFAIVLVVMLVIYYFLVILGVGGIFTSFTAIFWTKLYQAFLAREPDTVV